MTIHAKNPFVYSRAVTPLEAIDRPNDVARLMKMVEGGNNATLYAARRMGKTSLLKQLGVAAQERDIPSVLVDFSDVLSEADIAARLEQAFRALPGSLRRFVDRELGSIGLTTPLLGLNLGRRVQQPDALAVIHALLELPATIAERNDRRVLVIFDEFQALVALKGLDGVFRSHLQHHDRVAYVFSGSEPSLLRALFEDRARPLYGQAEQVRLGRVSFEDAHDFVGFQFKGTGKNAGETVAELVNLSERHPQRLMLLAHRLWEEAPGSKAATMSHLRVANDAALRAVDAELRFLWDALSANERRVIAALASGFSPYEASARLFTGIASSSSAQRGVGSLMERAILEREDDELRVLDPFLARWARRRGAARVQVYVLPDFDGTYRVTDGPSLAFTRHEQLTLRDAETEADRIAATGRGADVMIIDSDDPNDLPDWASSRDPARPRTSRRKAPKR